MTTKSREIKKALKQAFPAVKFSVTYKYPYGYRVEWENGIVEGATSEAVYAIADAWSTEERTEIGYGEYYYSGDSVNYNHEITDDVWREFVVSCVKETACVGVYFDEVYKYFKDEDGTRAYHENEDLDRYLHNGIKSDLDSDEAIGAKDNYYRSVDQKLIDDRLAEEKAYLEQVEIPSECLTYVGKEFDSYVVARVEHRLDRGDYYLENRTLKLGSLDRLPEISEIEVYQIYIICDQETGKESEIGFEDLQDKLDPIVPINTIPCQTRTKAKFPVRNKCDALEEYLEQLQLPQERPDGCPNWNVEDCLITEVVHLSNEHYDRFVDSLLNTYDFIAGKGGTCCDIQGLEEIEPWEMTKAQLELYRANAYSICLAVTASNRDTILVNPEGFSYSRYVGFPLESISYVEVEEEIKESMPTGQNITIPDVEIIDFKSIYKAWVEQLLQDDRISEIINYEQWRSTSEEQICQEHYKQFLDRCLSENLLDRIISFEDWQKTINLDR